MAAIIISNNQMQFPFGMQSNQAIGRLIALSQQMARLAEAVSTASAGFTGTPGTQFETGNIDPQYNVPNLFGVQANTANPGEQGQAFNFAMGNLTEQWNTFWELAKNYIEALDNGQMWM